jgi:hypothetical protein
VSTTWSPRRKLFVLPWHGSKFPVAGSRNRPPATGMEQDTLIEKVDPPLNFYMSFQLALREGTVNRTAVSRGVDLLAILCQGY